MLHAQFFPHDIFAASSFIFIILFYFLSFCSSFCSIIVSPQQSNIGLLWLLHSIFLPEKKGNEVFHWFMINNLGNIVELFHPSAAVFYPAVVYIHVLLWHISISCDKGPYKLQRLKLRSLEGLLSAPVLPDFPVEVAAPWQRWLNEHECCNHWINLH